MVSGSVAKIQSQVANSFDAGHEVQDHITAFWYKSEWTSLVTPAPTVVLILGRLLQLSMSKDFKLIVPESASELLPYDYFAANVQHLANKGSNSLVNSRAHMLSIGTDAEGMLGTVKMIIEYLAKGTGDDIPKHVPRALETLQNQSADCLAQASTMSNEWHELLHIAQKLQEVSKSTKGDNEKQRQRDQAQKEYLETVKKTQAENTKLTKQWMDDAKEQWDKGEELLRDSIKHAPSGWELGLMDLAQGVTNSLKTGLDSYINQRLFKGNMIGLAQGVAAEKLAGSHHDPSGAPVTAAPATPSNQPTTPSTPSSTSFSDPGYARASIINATYSMLNRLVTGSEDGGIDWGSVDKDGKDGIQAIRAPFKVNLGSTLGDGEPSKTAKDLMTKGVEYCDQLDTFKVTKPEAEIKKLVKDVKKSVKQAQDFAAEATLSTSTPPVAQNAFLHAGETNKISDSSSWSKNAVEMSQFKIKSAESLLAASKDVYKNSTNNFLEANRQLADFTAKLTGMEDKVVDWDKILDILHRAINFLSQLTQCLHKLVEFFDTISSIVEDAAKKKMNPLIALIKDSTEDIAYGPLTVSGLTKQNIYDQTMACVKITRIVLVIAQIWTKLYDGHIREGVSILDYMGGEGEGDDRKKMIEESGRKLQRWADKSGAALADMVREEASHFEARVEERISKLKESFSAILPPPNDEQDRAIESLKTKFVENENRDMKKNIENTPVSISVQNLTNF